MPKISVILPNYNGGQYIQSAIQSILDQTFTDFELIVIDDKSTDNSVDVINQIKDSRIRLIKHSQNTGIVGALNTGINNAKGEYLARMDADDISLSDRFEKCIKVFEDNAEIGVVASWMQTFGNEKELWKYWDGNIQIQEEFWFGSPIPHPASMFRMSLVKKYNIEYQSIYPHMEDYLLFYNLSKHTKTHIIPEVLFKYRLHEKNITSINRDSYRTRLASIHAHIIQDRTGKIVSNQFLNILFQVSTKEIVETNTKTLIQWYKLFAKITGIQPRKSLVLRKKWLGMLFRLADVEPFNSMFISLRTGTFNWTLVKYSFIKILRDLDYG